MSVVTNTIIATGLGENISYLEEKFKEFEVNGLPFCLVSVDAESLPKGWYGGSKYLEANLFLGAFNHLDLQKLVAFMHGEVKWEDPWFVQLIVKEQEDAKFRIIDIFPEYAGV